MSPANPQKKMSKSLGQKHYIDVFADDNRIRKQIRSAVTDTGDAVDGQMSQGVTNLFELLKACGKNEDHQQLMETYQKGELRYSDLKDAVGNGLVEISSELRERKAELMANKKNVQKQIQASSYEIRKKAQQTLKEVRSITGLMKMRY